MYYKMRILPVIFLFSMMTKAQDNFILGFLIHGVNLILNKGMTGIWIARRYWLFFYIDEPIYPSVYHVFGGGQDYFLQSSFFIIPHKPCSIGVLCRVYKGGNPYQSSFTADTGTYRLCADKVVCKRVYEVERILLN